MQDNTNRDGAAVHGTKASGEKYLRGYNAVDPKGHLVLLKGDAQLPDAGWRWATSGDLEAAESAEKANAQKALQKGGRKGGPIRGK